MIVIIVIQWSKPKLSFPTYYIQQRNVLWNVKCVMECGMCYVLPCTGTDYKMQMIGAQEVSLLIDS